MTSSRSSKKHRDGTSLKTLPIFFYTILFYVWRKNVQNKEHKWFIVKEKVHLIISSSGASLSKSHFKVGVKTNNQLLVIIIRSLENYLWCLRTKRNIISVLCLRGISARKFLHGWFKLTNKIKYWIRIA